MKFTKTLEWQLLSTKPSDALVLGLCDYSHQPHPAHCHST